MARLAATPMPAGRRPASSMDVTGGATATLPLPLAESYYRPGIPNGTFTLRLRAVNATGASTQSDRRSRHLRRSSSCTAPRVPAGYFATRVGNQVVILLGAAGGGTPATSYHITSPARSARGSRWPAAALRPPRRRAPISQCPGGERLWLGSVHGVPDRRDPLGATFASIAMHTHTSRPPPLPEAERPPRDARPHRPGLRAGATALRLEACAAPVNDYKALVCIYLFGGNDGNNLVVPVGQLHRRTQTRARQRWR